MDREREGLIQELRALERHMAEIGRMRREAARQLDADMAETRERILAIQDRLHDVQSERRNHEQLAHVFLAIARGHLDEVTYDKLLALACQEIENPGSILPFEGRI